MIDANTSVDCATSPVDCKIDAVRDDALLDRMAQTLRSVGCRCTYDVPYEPHIVTHECARCRCLREYQEMQAVPA